MPDQNRDHHLHHHDLHRTGSPVRSRRERFFAGYAWLILRNVIGWLLIVTSFIAGPFVPGPGGIPLFLIGFALVSFPGKRGLTARVLRGRPVWLWSLRVVLITILWSVAALGIAIWIFGDRWQWLADIQARGPATVIGVYAAAMLATWMLTAAALLGINLIIRWLPALRRRFRPWLRRHRIRLLPPRWRRRLPHEHGTGPLRLKDEILAILKHSHRRHGSSN